MTRVLAGKRRNIRFSASVFLLALAVRGLYLWEISSGAGFRFPLIDALRYFNTALSIASGDLLGGPLSYWQPPLYPCLLGLGVAIFGPNPVALRIAHLILGAFNCVLLYRLGRRVFSERVARAASLIACAYGPFLFFEGEYLPPVILTFLSLTALLAVIRADDTSTPGAAFLAGLVFGFHAIARPDILLFLPMAIAWLVVRRYRETRMRAMAWRMALLSIGVILPILPVTARNYEVEGVFVPISYNGGINFYIGNNPDFDRTVGIRPGVEWLDLVTEPFTKGPIPTDQRSTYFFQKAFDWIREDPGGWLRLMARKGGMFWQGHEFMRNLNLYSARRDSGLLAVLLWERGLAFPFGLVAPLALLGLAMSLRKRSAGTGLLVLFTVSSFLSVTLFFVTSRYRVPLVPVLLLFACHGAVELRQRARERRWTSALPAAAALGVLLFLSNRSPADAMRQTPADEVYWDGTLAAKRGDSERARALFRQAMREDPSNAQYQIDFALASQAIGDRGGAERQFRAILAREGEVPVSAILQSHKYLGILYRLDGADQKAEAELRAAVSMAPYRTDGRLLLARLLFRQGLYDRAEEELLELLEIDPTSDRAIVEMARISLKRGRAPAAVEELERAIELNPASIDARLVLANALLSIGREDEATRVLTQVLAIDPGNEPARVLLRRAEEAKKQGTR